MQASIDDQTERDQATGAEHINILVLNCVPGTIYARKHAERVQASRGLTDTHARTNSVLNLHATKSDEHIYKTCGHGRASRVHSNEAYQYDREQC